MSLVQTKKREDVFVCSHLIPFDMFWTFFCPLATTRSYDWCLPTITNGKQYTFEHHRIHQRNVVNASSPLITFNLLFGQWVTEETILTGFTKRYNLHIKGEDYVKDERLIKSSLLIWWIKAHTFIPCTSTEARFELSVLEYIFAKHKTSFDLYNYNTIWMLNSCKFVPDQRRSKDAMREDFQINIKSIYLRESPSF